MEAGDPRSSHSSPLSEASTSSCSARVVDLSRSAGHEEASLAENSYRLLARIQDQEPDAVNAVVQHPAVAAWARQTIDTLRSSSANAGAHPGQIAALAAAAVISSRDLRARPTWPSAMGTSCCRQSAARLLRPKSSD